MVRLKLPRLSNSHNANVLITANSLCLKMEKATEATPAGQHYPVYQIDINNIGIKCLTKGFGKSFFITPLVFDIVIIFLI